MLQILDQSGALYASRVERVPDGSSPNETLRTQSRKEKEGGKESPLSSRGLGS